jgi:predicted restriction endonuclease
MLQKQKRLVDEDALKECRAKACQICRTKPVDAAHILTKGAGNPDVWWNLLPLCRVHHAEQHTIGWFKMCEKYPMLKMEIYQRGFVFDGYKKLRRE